MITEQTSAQIGPSYPDQGLISAEVSSVITLIALMACFRWIWKHT